YEGCNDGINRRRLSKRGGGFASFNKTDGLADASAQIIVHNEAGVLAQAWRSLSAILKMLARERRDDEPAGADQRRHRLAEGHTTYYSAEAHGEKAPTSNIQAPEKHQAP